jgi:Kef-type K+ transport system membrane component KefB
MTEFYPFFIIIFAGVFFSMVFKRMHVPWVVGLILGGIVIGPQIFNVLTITPTAEFVGQIGLVFLMFMAGLETRLSDFGGFRKSLLLLSFINGAVPFIVGVGLTLWLGYTLIGALLVGIIFVSSSIAIVVPSLEKHNLLGTHIGQSVVITSVIQDIASLILLSFVLQSTNPVTSLPLYVFYPLLFLIIVILRALLPWIARVVATDVRGSRDSFQQEFRATFLILLGTVIAFEIMGLHPITAGFFAGFVLSDTITSHQLKDKIRTISYGVFIPTFFILVGAQTDIRVFMNSSATPLLVVVIILGSIISKFTSGWIGARIVGFSSDQSLLFAVSSIPQLSTTLAVAFTAHTLGYIDQQLITAMVALSIVTVIVSPSLMSVFGKRIQESV